MRTGCDQERQAHREKAGFSAFLALTTATLLAACTAPSRYAGIDLRAGSPVAPEIQTLAVRARSGDKHAQLELGIRYEVGRGVPQDVKQARRLYRLAATTTRGMIYVYQPAVKKGERGGVVPMNTGPMVKGLEAAKVRLTADRSTQSVSCLSIVKEQEMLLREQISASSSEGFVTAWQTKLPDTFPGTPIILQDIDWKLRNGQTYHRPIAWIENSDDSCWQGMRWTSPEFPECYKIQRHSSGNFDIENDLTKLFLSTLAFIVTRGKTDDLYKSEHEIKSNLPTDFDRSTILDVDLHLNISAPSEISNWYVCQACAKLFLFPSEYSHKIDKSMFFSNGIYLKIATPINNSQNLVKQIYPINYSNSFIICDK